MPVLWMSASCEEEVTVLYTVAERHGFAFTQVLRWVHGN